jgi:nucleoside-diphosphate-sugar epimerase
MKRVLLTGASGFVGSHCLPALSNKGFEVHAVSRTIEKYTPSEVRWHQADLLDRKQVLELVSNVEPTHLLHLAWYAAPGSYWSSEENLRWVQASLDLLQAFTAAGGRRVVVSGSCAEYEWGSHQPLSERDTPKPSTLYGTCKHSLQLMVDAYAATKNISAAWGRLFFLYGPNEPESRLVPSVIRALLRGQPALCTHGDQVRDFLYVADVAEAFVTLLDSEVKGTINIASGRPIKIRDVIDEIGEQLGRRDLIRLNALPASPNEPAVLLADTDRLKRELRWQPRYDLRQGVVKCIDWLRSKDPAHPSSVVTS